MYCMSLLYKLADPRMLLHTSPTHFCSDISTRLLYIGPCKQCESVILLADMYLEDSRLHYAINQGTIP